MSVRPRILISGAGIAGPAVAWFIHKGLPEASLTIIERSPEVRNSGHAVDIRGAAVEIAKEMGILEKIKEHNTTEIGMKFVDEKRKVRAAMGATGDEKKQAFTSEYEILRGDLAMLLWEHTRDFTEYVFSDYVTETIFSDNGKKVTVKTKNGKLQTDTYDALIAADGFGSKIRTMVFPEESKDCVKSLKQFCALMAIPKEEGDDRWAKWYNAPGGRMQLMRPDNHGMCRAAFVVTSPKPEMEKKLLDAQHQGVEAQKAIMAEVLKGSGYEEERIRKGMMEADDFYYTLVAQIKISNIAKNNTALVGDAGYCPTFNTGFGTSLGLIGAYTLAGEIVSSPNDLPAAMARYQESMKEIISIGQQLMPGGPSLMCPQTKTGISILRFVMSVAASRPVQAIAGKFGGADKVETWRPKPYPALTTVI